jgi:hypothetical protein
MKGRGARPAKDLYVAPRMQPSIVGQVIMNPKYLDPRYKVCIRRSGDTPDESFHPKCLSSEVM